MYAYRFIDWELGVVVTSLRSPIFHFRVPGLIPSYIASDLAFYDFICDDEIACTVNK